MKRHSHKSCWVRIIMLIKYIYTCFVFRQLLLIEFHIYHVCTIVDRSIRGNRARHSRRRNHFAFVRPIKIYIKVSRAQHDSS